MKNSLTNDSTYIVIVDDEKVGDPPKPPEPHRLLDVDVVILSQPSFSGWLAKSC